MRGALLPVWAETWRAVWAPLARSAAAPPDLFAELYREILPALKTPPSAARLGDLVAGACAARAAFRRLKPADLAGEPAAVAFLERAHAALGDVGGDALANRYFQRVEAFILKFNLRYDLRRPFALAPTLSGVFASLVGALKDFSAHDPHLNSLMVEFEESMRDLKTDASAGRVKICLQKQINLMEGLGRRQPGVGANSLGRICEQVGTWPHVRIKDAAKALYGFTCEYPGIRHGGAPESALRDVGMADVVAMTAILTGFSAYLVHGLDADDIYRGG